MDFAPPSPAYNANAFGKLAQNLIIEKAVNESTEFLLLNALDHRAAALEKLERLQPALKDSKRMIDLKPELSKASQIIKLFCLIYLLTLC
jgi:F-box/TPR repeat protein Pof3